MTECLPIAGAVVRPLVDPVPLYPWAMVHRRDLHHPGLETLAVVAAEMSASEGWLEVPEGAWLPAQS